MVLDTSAIAAILFDEPERHRFDEAIEAHPRRLISAVTLVEATMVVERRYGAPGGLRLERFLQAAEVETISVTPEQALIACGAFRRFGKGRHPAGLNLGDCFAYALAKASGEPLLYKGDDFARTDVQGC